MQAIFALTLPFFALILCGYIGARTRLLPEGGVGALNGFVFYFALPAMLFSFMAARPIAAMLNPRYFAAHALAGITLLVGVAFVLRRLYAVPAKDAAFLGLSAGFSNSGYLALPMLVPLLGEVVAAPIVLAMVADLTLVTGAVLAMAETGDSKRPGWGAAGAEVVRNVATSPLILAVALGLLASGTHAALPLPLASFIALLASAAGPCALFAIGASLHGRARGSDYAPVALASAGKLLLHPLVMWLLMHYVFRVDPLWATVAVLNAAMPTGGNAFIFARQYGADAERVSSTILVTTSVAVVSVSLLIWALGTGPVGPLRKF